MPRAGQFPGQGGSYDGLVPDQKPPRLAAGEPATVHALLQYQRDSLVRKVAGLDDAAARRSPVNSGTSPLQATPISSAELIDGRTGR